MPVTTSPRTEQMTVSFSTTSRRAADRLSLVAGNGIRFLVLVLATSRAVEAQDAADIEFFESMIRPVLSSQCYECHNSHGTSEGGLMIDFRDGLLKGGDNGAVLVPGKPEQSRLLAVLRHEVKGSEMPQGGPKLSPAVITNFESWIRRGAVDPRHQPPSDEDHAAATAWPAVFEQRMSWWSFQPIQSPDPPDLPSASGQPADSDSVHPIDRFIRAKLLEQGLTPAQPAEDGLLIRRMFYAIIGLPPTPDELARWTSEFRAASGSTAARSNTSGRLADELLARPQFGERWARHWMDWIRYADSHGSEGDPVIDNSWFYRDYLIRALNRDVPYDQLVREHLAGDLLPEPRRNQDLKLNESAIGTAHWRMVFHGFAPTDALEERVRFTDDQVNAFSKGFLGLTVACARCHNHKFDAISQKDYYALYGVLTSCRPARTIVSLPTTADPARQRMTKLKEQLRQTTATAWLRSVDTIPIMLQADSGPWQSAEKPASVLYDWHQWRTQSVPADQFPAWWRDQVAAWQKQRPGQDFASGSNVVRSWNLADPKDQAEWYRRGNGLTTSPSAPGEFTIALNGDRMIDRILPAGTYSHLLSAKDAARLESPDLQVDDNYDVWLQIIGDGTAMSRYVVQNYPRNGTVYPVPKVAKEWNWQRFDVGYWQGDRIHLELTTAKDAPLLVENADRSWFGIRRAMVVRKDQPQPHHPVREHVDALYETALRDKPESAAELANCFATTLREAITAWRDGNASDAQAMFLQQCLAENLLTNSPVAVSDAAPLLDEFRMLEAALPVPIRVPGIEDTTSADQPLYVRGDHRLIGDMVPRRFLEAIDSRPFPHIDRDAVPENVSVSGRLELAERMLQQNNPLTRRVIVNRLWHHLFGRGIVSTPDNFGRMGKLPTHPELLDWLATRFARDHWSLKSIIRLMVTSATWQQSSVVSDLARTKDPDNQLLACMSVRRLEGEAIRDALLAVSGTLDPSMFGPPVSGNSARRSVYVEVRRNALDPFLRAFDFPEPFSTVGRRDVTNVPAQSLTLMNDPRIEQLAQTFAAQFATDTDESEADRIARIYRTTLSRFPTETETTRSTAQLKAVRTEMSQMIEQSARLREKIASRNLLISQITDPVRTRLLDDAKARRAARPSGNPDIAAEIVPAPVSAWDFEQDAQDSVGDAHLNLADGAAIQNGALVVDGTKAHAVSQPLSMNLREKTLEAWVQLANFDQRAGGVMTVQTPDGNVFDSIVFAEKDPQQWLAGSNVFARTQSFGGPSETEAVEKPVHLAIVYGTDGQIAGYRNGEPYGQPYRSAGPFEFRAGQTVVSFGVRHLPAIGNRLLAGRILQARLFDRALTPEQIRAAANHSDLAISESQLFAALTVAQQQHVQQARAEIRESKIALESLGAVPDPGIESVIEATAWTELVRGVFCFKEFVYLR